jgi:multiple sugar transport system permease protein
MKYRTNKILAKYLMTFIMAGLSFFMIIPFLWMFSASFKFENQVFNVPIDWIPKRPTLSNYIKVWNSTIPFSLFFFNSVKISVWCVSGEVFTSALAGYAFQKLNFMVGKLFSGFTLQH